MVRVNENFLKQITKLAKDGAATVNNYLARIINVNDPIDDYDAVNKRYLDSVIGGGVSKVTSSASGTVNAYTASQRRIFHSDGLTSGGLWSQLTLSDNSAAFSDYSLPLVKLSNSGASTGYSLIYSGTEAVWANVFLRHDGTIALSNNWNAGATYRIKSILPIADEDVVIKKYVDDAIEGVTGSGMSKVTSAAIGAVDMFPASVTRAWLSDGTTSGGVWRQWTYTDCGNVFATGAIAPAKISTSGASSLQIIRNVGGTAVWSNESTGSGTNSRVTFHDLCLVAMVENVNISSPGSYFRGVTFTAILAGQARMFLVGQTVATQNGPWIWNGASSALTRPADWTGTVDCTYAHVFPIYRSSDTVTRTANSISGGLYLTAGNDSGFIVDTETMAWMFLAPEQNVIHDGCSFLSTKNISVTAPDGTGIDYTYSSDLVSGFTRILLVKQTTGRENGPWIWNGIGNPLSRPVDWYDTNNINGNVVHEFPVSIGNLWGNPTIWYTIGSGIVWGQSSSFIGTSFTWYHVGGASDVIDLSLTANLSAYLLFDNDRVGDEDLYTSSAIEVRGKVTIDETSYTTWFNENYHWETVKAFNFETTPFTDSDGDVWDHYMSDSTVDTGTWATRDASTYYSGSYSWRLSSPSTTASVSRTIFWHPSAANRLRAGNRYRVRAATDIHGSSRYVDFFWAKLKYDSSYAKWLPSSTPGEHDSFAKLYYDVIGSGWNAVDGTLDIPSTLTGSSIAFCIKMGKTSQGGTSTTGYAFVDSLQIDQIPLYAPPNNNIIIDTSYWYCNSNQTVHWISASDFSAFLELDSVNGNLYAPICEYTRHYRLAVYTKRINVQSDTSIEQTLPADDIVWQFGS